MQKSMLLISSRRDNAPTFRLIPVINDTPFLEGIYIPQASAMVLFYKHQVDGFHMLPTLDSNGDPVPKEIDVLCKRIIQQAKSIGIELKFGENAPFEHQFENTECGMYSLYFIASMVMDKHNCSYFKTHRVTDAMMKQMRLKMFTVGGD